MPYMLSYEEWLSREVARVRCILLAHMDPERSYTLEGLLTLCADYGLHYDNPVYQEIGQALIADGFLIVVPG